jgi:hypothetical protein
MALASDPKDIKKIKLHQEAMATQLNQVAAMDRDFMNAPGVSPIRMRHPMDLYGSKSGIGHFNPIMV